MAESKKKGEKRGKAERKGEGERDPEREARIDRLLKEVQEEVKKRLGPDATFEERSDAGFEIMKQVLNRRDGQDLREQVTQEAEVEVGGKRYRRLKQSSSATYYGPWGSHRVSEALYREIGVHNGPTIKPVELRVGMIAGHMTPNLARIAGELSGGCSSRELIATMRAVGMSPPSRAFLERRVKRMGDEMAEQIEELEEVVRQTTPLPQGVASVSCGLDRFSVRMSESPQEDTEARPVHRSEPYERTPPAPQEHHYRKAWVGTATVYDNEGTELHTWRYSVEADADAKALADRVAADVAKVIQEHPQIPVHCIQDGAPELRALPEALARALPHSVKVRELVDFEHLVKEYLDHVVDACEPEGDPSQLKGRYRELLLSDDLAIDDIWSDLKDRQNKRPPHDRPAHEAISAALSYIDKRKHKMRYASHYDDGLPIGSGATEGTCFAMQRRVQRPGQSWKTIGLRGTLTLRALVLSDRWTPAWRPYAAAHRKVVQCAN